MILGIIAAILCIFLVLKFASRKLKWNTMNQILKKGHIPCGIAVIMLFAIHIIITMDVWAARAVSVLVTGFITSLLIIRMAYGYFIRKKLGSRWLKLHRIGALSIILALSSHVILYNMDFISYKNSVAEIQIDGMNADDITDGIYEGEYDVGYIYAKVEVIISNGRIEEIHILKHKNERGGPAEAVVDRIIKNQTTKVDAVSGATNSSRVIEKAVENALQKSNN